MRPGRSTVYDPTVGEWSFDTSSLINLDIGELLDVAMDRFAGRAHLVEEVLNELDKGSTGQPVRSRDWFTFEQLDVATHATKYRSIRLRWPTTEPGKDEGEAATIVLAAEHHWRMVCEDGIGHKTARFEEGICVMRTVDLLVAMVRARWVTGDEAWAGYERMVRARRRLGVVPWSTRQEFDQLCNWRHGYEQCV